MTSPWNARSIFQEAVEKHPPDRWPAFLDANCGDDANLRQQVEVLLAAHVDGSDGTTTQIFPEPSERQGALIGPYRLQGVLGQGGMGTVYLAEQTSPVRRHVALKIIRPGLDSREVIARFEAERQALAMMDHSNIAHVLDGGTTAQGRPYFVMELVRGIPITEYCDKNNVSVNERLELFVTVCQAVQHAHQKGIIHRDLKPSNVLVTVQDGPPVPKVIDFGVAKATTQSLTDRTLVTNISQIVGTPLYMSPEQAEMSGLDVDTRSDIYSLGVLLYELLTGTTPFDQVRLKQAGLDELRRIIREEEPPRPSTRLSTLRETAASTATHRRVDAEKLGQIVRGDLDWIVMKALEKDRTRRYETANAFARDIQRFLTDQPIEARPPSTTYRFRKFARRNRLAITTISLVSVALLAGTIVSTWLAIKAIHAEGLADEALANEKIQHDYAEEQRKLAKTEADASRQVTDFLVGLFEPPEGSNWMGYQTGAVEQMGKTLTAREIVDRGSRKTLEELNNQPDVQVRMMDTIGYIYRCLGQVNAAEPLLVDALAKRTELLGKDHADTANSLDHLAGLRYDQGKNVEATRLYREALAIRRKLLGDDNLLVADSLTNLGFLETQGGDKAEAHKCFRESLEIRRRHLPPNHRDIGFSLWGAGWALVRDHRYSTGQEKANAFKQAQVYNDEARAILMQHKGGVNPGLASCEFLDSEIRRYNGRLAESEPYLRKAVDIDKKVLGENHPLVVALMMEHAAVLYQIGKRQEAEPQAQKVLELAQRMHAETKAIPAGMVPQLAEILFREDAPPEQQAKALELTQVALEVKQKEWDRLREQRGYNARLALEQLADYHSIYGRRLLLVHQLALAEVQFLKTREYSDQLVKDFAQKKIRDTSFHDFRLLGGQIAKAGNLVAALDWYAKAESIMLSRVTVDPANTSDFYWSVRHTDHHNGIMTGRAWQLFQEQKPEEGDRLYVEQVRHFKQLMSQFPALPAFRINLGRTLTSRAEFQFYALKNRDAALASLREARNTFSILPAEIADNGAYLAEKAASDSMLGKLLGAIGQPAEAEPILRDAVASARNASNVKATDAENRRRYVEACRNLAATLLQLKKHADVAEIDEGLAREAQTDATTKMAVARDFHECARLASTDPALKEETRPTAVARYERLCVEFADASLAQVTDGGPLNDLAWKLSTFLPATPERGALAVRLARRSLELSPQNGSFFNTLGAATYRAGNWKGAEDALEQSLGRLGYQQFAFNGYFNAMALWQQGRKDDAAKWFGAADLWMLKNSPQDADLQTLRDEAAKLLEVPVPKGNETQAAPTNLPVTERILEAAPNAGWAYSMRGFAHAELEEWDKAAADFAKATELQRVRWYDWYQLALVQLARNDHVQFQHACAGMVETFSKSEAPDIARMVAWTCALGPNAVGDYAAPISAAERTIAAKASSPLVFVSRAALRFRSGRLKDAVAELQAFEKSAVANSDAPPEYAWCFLAMAHHDLGHEQEARMWMDKAVASTDKILTQPPPAQALPWNRRLTLKLLRKEAEAHLGKSNPGQAGVGGQPPGKG